MICSFAQKSRFPKMGVPPNHPFVDGFSTINHPFWDHLRVCLKNLKNLALNPLVHHPFSHIFPMVLKHLMAIFPTVSPRVFPQGFPCHPAAAAPPPATRGPGATPPLGRCVGPDAAAQRRTAGRHLR